MIKMYVDYMKAKLGSKKGQGMVEYGLIVGIVAVLIIAVFVFLREPITNLFRNIGGVIDTSATGVK